MVKKVMFVFILELLNREGHLAFFDLQKGGRKANNAQKEKRRLARKRSRAAKWEREREAAKVAKLPPRERECLTCGRKFQSRKTVKRHKCTRHSKVVCKKEEAAAESSSHPVPPAKPIMLVAPPTPLAPPAPSHSNAAPPVTGVLAAPSTRPPLFTLTRPPLARPTQPLPLAALPRPAPVPCPASNVPPAVRAAMGRDLSGVNLVGLQRLSSWLEGQKDPRCGVRSYARLSVGRARLPF